MVTREQIDRDYVDTDYIMSEFACSHQTATRWIKKYFDQDAVEVLGGRYYVRKDEVERWRQRYKQSRPVRGRRLRHIH